MMRRPRTLRPRRARGAQESLGQIVLGFEAIITFLAGLVIYGLKSLPAGVPDWWGIVGGVVVALLMLIVSGLLRHRWAIVAGSILQVIVLAAALLVPAILVIVVLFGGMWVYAAVKGAALDRRNAAGTDAPDAEPPDPDAGKS